MKRIIALLLIALFAVSLSACDFNDLYGGEDAEAPTADLPEKDSVTAISPESSETEKYPSENRVITTYKEANPQYTDVSIKNYYGIYNNNVVVMINHGGNYFGEVWTEQIGEIGIEYRDSNRILLLTEDNALLSLTQAYKQGYLTDADIADIAAKHKGFLK